jgi:hypothetical protein
MYEFIWYLFLFFFGVGLPLFTILMLPDTMFSDPMMRICESMSESVANLFKRAVPRCTLKLPSDTRAYRAIRVFYRFNPIGCEGCAQYLKEMRAQWAKSGYGRTYVEVLTYCTLVHWFLNSMYLHFGTTPFKAVGSKIFRVH